eukprot:TRINITY_DN3743_c0_g1_i6.p1 TRINITY_DN3743_c0_g1~~TRINITY_DN3743_c0_g1_i6.p1  ORF type:complete len:102 (+),score=43.84 TRINITY_DN3743_c0_g1_i6:88-393(+)
MVWKRKKKKKKKKIGTAEHGAKEQKKTLLLCCVFFCCCCCVAWRFSIVFYCLFFGLNRVFDGVFKFSCVVCLFFFFIAVYFLFYTKAHWVLGFFLFLGRSL